MHIVQHLLVNLCILLNFCFFLSIAIKRQSVDDLGEDRRQVLTEVSQLITGGNMQMQMIGCSILSALMAEYATTVKSSDVGLAWEIHFKAKKQFELTDLKSIFTFCVQALKGKLPFRLHTVKTMIRVDFLFILFGISLDSYYESTLIIGRLLILIG